MSATIKDPGGIVVRSMEAIDGFRATFGYWPDSLEAHPDTIAAMATECFTPLGFFLLQSKVRIVRGEVDLIATGRDGDRFRYAVDEWDRAAREHSAMQWLQLTE
jgi:hypothetical protein